IRPMLPSLASYFLFGAGYITYMTFMIAFLRSADASPAEQAAFWCAIGVGGVLSPLAWSGALGRLGGGKGLAAGNLVTLIGAAAPLLARSFPAELLSGVVAGLGIFGVTAATSVFVRKTLPPAAWASGVGAMTVAFSLGQTVGPVLTGFVTDAFGSLSAGLGCGAGLLALAVVIAAAQRDLPAFDVAPPGAMPDDLRADRAL
ncbi:MAG: YbfB/YjiJ family MFS transporter, partial [Hansschlegelia sp.]